MSEKCPVTNFELGEAWKPDLSTPEGIKEAIGILGEPLVQNLINKNATYDSFTISSVDLEKKIITLSKDKT